MAGTCTHYSYCCKSLLNGKNKLAKGASTNSSYTSTLIAFSTQSFALIKDLILVQTFISASISTISFTNKLYKQLK